MVFSTTPAGFGQIIHLQDINTINAYQPHRQIAVTSIAVILVGGATVAKPTNKQAFMSDHFLWCRTLYIVLQNGEAM